MAYFHSLLRAGMFIEAPKDNVPAPICSVRANGDQRCLYWTGNIEVSLSLMRRSHSWLG